MQVNVEISVSDLCKALEESSSPNAEIRNKCENLLAIVQKKSGYRSVILEIIKDVNFVTANVRMPAAIFFKNSLKDIENISKEETNILLRDVYNCLLFLEKKEKEIYSQLLQCMKIFIQKKYPDDFGIMNNILEDLDQRKDVKRLYVSLYCLKLIFKQLKLRKREMRETFDKTVSVYYYPLVKCVVDLYTADINNTEVSEILCLLSKLYYYIYECAFHKNEIILENLDTFFALYDQILKCEIKIDNYIDDEQYLKNIPQYKCKKIVLNIVVTMIAKFVNRNYNNFASEVTKRICEIFLNKWLAVYYDDIIITLHNYHKDKKTLTSECLTLLLQGLSYGLENAEVYNTYIKTNFDFIIKNIVFPILCYDSKEIEDVIFDEYNYAVDVFNSFAYADLKSYAVDFLKDLTRYRGTKHIPQLCQFCENVLNAYNMNYEQIYSSYQNTMNNANVTAVISLEQRQEALLNNESCKYKFGALKILECIRSRLCDKKRNMNIEEFLKTYIENDLNSEHVLLCHESILLYCSFIRKCNTIADINRVLYNYNTVLNHMNSKHLLLRVTSAAYIRHFFKIKNVFLKETIIKSIPILIERLLNIIKEAKFEMILMSLDSLTYNFKDYIAPYVNEVVVTLCTSYVHFIRKKDEEMNSKRAAQNRTTTGGWTSEGNDVAGMAMIRGENQYGESNKEGGLKDEDEEEDEDLNSVCLSILTEILNLLESVNEEKKVEIYKSVLPWLYIVIDESFKMPTFEHFEEAIVLLTNITYYLDINQDVYLRFERLFDIYYFNNDEEIKKQELEFMRSNPDYVLSPFLDVPFRNKESLYEFILDVSYAIGFIDNICSKNVEQFVKLHSVSHSIKYVHMIFRLAVEAWRQKVRKSSMKLLFVLFEGNVQVKGISELMTPVLNLVHHGLLENDRILKEIKDKEGVKKKNEEGNINANFGANQNQTNAQGNNSAICSESDDDSMESDMYRDDVLSSTDIEYIKQLLYALIVYDIESFFCHFINNGAISYILNFMSVLDEVKNNKTRKMYILAMSRILEKIESPHINPHILDLNAFIVNLATIANMYYENKQVEDKASTSEESEDSIDCNSEMEIDDNEDTTNEKAYKLIKKLEDIKNKNMAAMKNMNNSNNDNTAITNPPEASYFNNAMDTNANNAMFLNDRFSDKLQKNNLSHLLERENIEDEEDDESDYEYDDLSDDSDDENRTGLFDELNAFQVAHDIVTGFYGKYQNLFNAEVVMKLKHLCESDAQDALRKSQEEQKNK